MAIDSALKRKAATGVGRLWMRGTYPGTSGISADERAATASVYPVAVFEIPATSVAGGIVGSVVGSIVNSIVGNIAN